MLSEASPIRIRLRPLPQQLHKLHPQRLKGKRFCQKTDPLRSKQQLIDIIPAIAAQQQEMFKCSTSVQSTYRAERS